MLLFAVLSVILVTNVYGQYSLTVRENQKLCSQWFSSLNFYGSVSYIPNSACIGSVRVEEDWLTMRLCCSTVNTAITTLRPTTTFRPTTTTTAAPVSSQDCGKQKYQPSKNRIVGGGQAVPNSWPWQVRLDAAGNLCGGTLIDRRHVLTAAHCLLYPNYPSLYSIYAGVHEINKPATSEQRYAVERIFVHEGYNERSHENDIAVIRLSKPVTLTDKVHLICLPGAEATKADETVWLVGWGTTSFQGYNSAVLKQTSVQLMPDRCSQIYPVYNKLKQMCAGTRTGGRDSCQGDSGGPLMYESNGRWYLNGVVSYGNGCGQAGVPGVYARVNYYLPWIRAKMQAI